MAFDEKLQKLLEEAQRFKPFNYDSIFRENNEFRKQHTLHQVQLKALSMEEKDVDLWWDVMQDCLKRYQKGLQKI